MPTVDAATISRVNQAASRGVDFKPVQRKLSRLERKRLVVRRCKRKPTLFRKCNEYAQLCDAQVLLVLQPNGSDQKEVFHSDPASNFPFETWANIRDRGYPDPILHEPANMPQVHDGHNSEEEDDQDSPPCQPTFALRDAHMSQESLDQSGQTADSDMFDVMPRREGHDDGTEAVPHGGQVDAMLLGHTAAQHGAPMSRGIVGATAAQRRVEITDVSRNPAAKGVPLAPQTAYQPAIVPFQLRNAGPLTAQGPAADLNANRSLTMRRPQAPGAPMRSPPPAALGYNRAQHMSTEPWSGSTIPSPLPHGVVLQRLTPHHASTAVSGNVGEQSRFNNASIRQQTTHFYPQDIISGSGGGRFSGTVFQNVSGPGRHPLPTLRNRSPPKTTSRRQDIRQAPPGAGQANALLREVLTTSTARKGQHPSRASQTPIGSSKVRHGRRGTSSRRVQDPQ